MFKKTTLEFIDGIYQGIIQTSLIEVFAVLIGLTYIILIAKENRIGWIFALISSSLYVYLSFSVQLYIEAILQTFYVVMAVYGWITWNHPTKNQQIKKLNIKWHFILIFFGTILSLLIGYLMQKYTNQNAPYLDAFTTVFSLSVTFMAAHRILENWLYWIVIDSALIFLYMGQELYLVGVNYFIYTIIAIFAYFSWRKSYKSI